jgi:membrane protein
LIIVSFMFAFLYWGGAQRQAAGFKWVSPGGLVGVVLWIHRLAAVRALPLDARLRVLRQDLRRLGGVISFLVWLWISNIAILLGAEFNAELERGRRMEEGEVGPRRSRSSSRATRRR